MSLPRRSDRAPRTIVVDLDGPILDGRERHVACYRRLARDMGFTPIAGAHYWRLKRMGWPVQAILARSGAAARTAAFEDGWRHLIETPDLLALDRLRPSATATLQRWVRGDYRLALVTMRRNADLVHAQLEHLGLRDTFVGVMASGPDAGGSGKADAVRVALPDLDPTRSLWIGDTEADVTAARALGCPIWALTCGLRSPAFLRRLAPDATSRSIGAIEPDELIRVPGARASAARPT